MNGISHEQRNKIKQDFDVSETAFVLLFLLFIELDWQFTERIHDFDEESEREFSEFHCKERQSVLNTEPESVLAAVESNA